MKKIIRQVMSNKALKRKREKMMPLDDVKLKLQPKVVLKRLCQNEISKLHTHHTDVGSSPQQGANETVTRTIDPSTLKRERPSDDEVEFFTERKHPRRSRKMSFSDANSTSSNSYIPKHGKARHLSKSDVNGHLSSSSDHLSSGHQPPSLHQPSSSPKSFSSQQPFYDHKSNSRPKTSTSQQPVADYKSNSRPKTSSSQQPVSGQKSNSGPKTSFSQQPASDPESNSFPKTPSSQEPVSGHKLNSGPKTSTSRQPVSDHESNSGPKTSSSQKPSDHKSNSCHQLPSFPQSSTGHKSYSNHWFHSDQQPSLDCKSSPVHQFPFVHQPSSGCKSSFNQESSSDHQSNSGHLAHSIPQPSSGHQLPPSHETSLNHQMFSSSHNGNCLGNGIASDNYSECNKKTVHVNVNETIQNGAGIPRLLLLENADVHPDMMRHLKPHQCAGVQFMWDRLIRSLQGANNNTVAGCILSHPSGFGKTVQAIAFLHTVLTRRKLPDIRTALILCLNNNIDHWLAEFSKWVPKSNSNNDGSMHFINLESATDEGSCAVQLPAWKTHGGIVICEYQTLRYLIENGNDLDYEEMILAPDILVCDDGHRFVDTDISLTQCLGKFRTKRKLILTSLPLQNNLIEYHGMVSLWNDNLLGSGKTFQKYFVNPIENGQHVNSTEHDINVMKKQAYVLQRLLSECVQRKDISVFKDYIPQKYEYTIKVKLSQLQGILYTKYLSMTTENISKLNQSCLFEDYIQCLLIVCHPRCLVMQKNIIENYLSQLSDNNDKNYQNGEEVADISEKDITLLADAPMPISLEDIHMLSKDKIRLFIVSNGGECPNTKSRMKLIDTASKYLGKHFYKSKEFKKLLTRKSVIELKAMIKGYGGDFVGCTEKNDLVDRAKQLAMRMATPSREEWFEIFLRNTPYAHIEQGGKIVLMLKILREACNLGDKVVIFSQSLITLDLIELVLQDDANVGKAKLCAPYSKWEKNNDYFRIDGSRGRTSYAMMVSRFNDQNNRRGRLILVLSTIHMAISLVGANRVILFDAPWWPTGDIEAISKVYRLGQTKKCYIYRLIARGTMEDKIYESYNVRPSFSYRIDSKSRVPKHFTTADIKTLYSYSPKQRGRASNAQNSLQDSIFASIIQSTDCIGACYKSDTLRDYQVLNELTFEECNAAWDKYRVDRGAKTYVSQSFLRSIESLPLHILISLSIHGTGLVQTIQKRIKGIFEWPVNFWITQIRMRNPYISTDQGNCNAVREKLTTYIELKRLRFLELVLLQHLNAVQDVYKSVSANFPTHCTAGKAAVGGSNSTLRFTAPFLRCTIHETFQSCHKK